MDNTWGYVNLLDSRRARYVRWRSLIVVGKVASACSCVQWEDIAGEVTDYG